MSSFARFRASPARRVNDQWCVIFKDGEAHQVQVIDYH
jgi:plasmid maintenance system killer protein